MADAVRIADLINDYEIARMLSRVPFPYALADAESFIAGVNTVQGRRNLPLAIEDRRYGQIGVVGLHTQDGAQLAELGYWLGRSFWGAGLATEAADAALEWAAGTWGCRAITSGHYADNPASGRVLEKVGFLYTGEVRLRFCPARNGLSPTRMMVRLA